MATKNKTKETEVDVSSFIENTVENVQKKADSYQLIDLFQRLTGCEAKMWGPTIIGFGSYAYTYESGHSGESPLLGFSPRKAAISLYIVFPGQINQTLIDQLGKFTMGKACIYVKKLSDINLKVLEQLCLDTLNRAPKKNIPN